MEYRRDLVCEVTGLSYDFDNRLGRLEIAANQCCDMGGCIRLFEGIDPKVEMIETFAGGKSDTIFKREPDGWRSVLTRSA